MIYLSPSANSLGQAEICKNLIAARQNLFVFRENSLENPSEQPQLGARAEVIVPTLYFAEGLPYTMVNLMSIILLKNLGLDNKFIGLYTSLLALPWTLKLLWAPMVDLYGSRRGWIVVAQLVLTGLTLLLLPALLSAHAVEFSLLIFALIAIASATHDIAIDGFYLDLLSRTKQALFVGVRNASYKMAWLFGSGAMVYLAGWWAKHQQNKDLVPNPEYINQGWAIAFGVCAAILCGLATWHQVALPYPKKQITASGESLFSSFPEVLKTFLDQKRIAVIILYVVIFRFGDALMLKMAQPFLLDLKTKGGLAISTEQVGIIYGTVGMIAFLVGGLLGGWLVSKFSLKRCLLPTALIQNGAILLYWFLALAKPDVYSVAVVNAFEQFAYGLGTAAYTVFLLGIVKEKYKASHYAIASALMAFGLILPGMVSGYLADALGYQNFFLVSFVASLPGIICILFLPFGNNSSGPHQDAILVADSV